MIVKMLHSPARTWDYATCLIGRRGTVVSVLRNGALALIEFDGEPDESPGGVRRWSVHWDGLEIFKGVALRGASRRAAHARRYPFRPAAELGVWFEVDPPVSAEYVD
uniref:hypothetical protein n=1 Tax=Nonomuraea lactucae TaxID=2249762 RepID=UPI0019668BAD